MLQPLRTTLSAFAATAPKGVLIVAGYVAAHYGLSLLSFNLEIARNVSVWFLPGGLLFGCLMVARGPQVGWVMAGVGFAFFVYSIVGWLAGATLPGWTSLMAAVGLLGGMQFLMLGIIGAYLGRLYDQSKGRPLFMIRDIVGGAR